MMAVQRMPRAMWMALVTARSVSTGASIKVRMGGGADFTPLHFCSFGTYTGYQYDQHETPTIQDCNQLALDSGHACFTYGTQAGDTDGTLTSDGVRANDCIMTTDCSGGPQGGGLCRWNVYETMDPAAASATGDPHLQNVHGERFDLMQPGQHVLISIPRGESAEGALLRVQADARRLGGCTDMYFQEVNITGSWVSSNQAGGYRYVASQAVVGTPQWVAFGKVELKVVHGRTQAGNAYLNIYAKHLGQAGFPIGGLLGEDDHEDVAALPAQCVRKIALQSRGQKRGVALAAAATLA